VPVPKPSTQTRFILEAMTTKEREDADRWERMMAKLDQLTEKVVGMDEVQQQLLAQASLAADVAQKAMEERVRFAQQLEQTGKEVVELRLEQMARDMESSKSVLNGRPRGAAPSPAPPENNRMYGGVPLHHNRDMGGRRIEEIEEGHLPIPRMPFPRFAGEEPRIWIDRCVDYFTLYRVPESVWVVSASLNMEGNASRWFQIFMIQYGPCSWEEFCEAVLLKFGSEEYSQAMQSLLEIRQTGSVEEYKKVFDEARYATFVHNHDLDETFFVAHFIKGLKQELQGPVKSHLPASVERAALLARIQQGILDKQRQKSFKMVNQGRLGGVVSKSDTRGSASLPEPSKERLVKEYRRQNGLCYTCGDKFEPGHQAHCPKKCRCNCMPSLSRIWV
jgi:hypothetical protein